MARDSGPHGRRSRRGVARVASILARLLLTVCLVSLVAVLALAALGDRGRIYTLDIDTEVMSLVVGDTRYSEWSLAGARLYADPFDDEAVQLGSDAVVLMNPGVSVEIQRHGVGAVNVRLECDGGAVGRIEGDEGISGALGQWALLRFELEDKPLVLSFSGYLSVGEDVASQVDSMVLGGEVSIIEQKFASRGHYTAGGEAIDAGDRVQLWRTATDSATASLLQHSACTGSRRLILNEDAPELVASRMAGFVRAEPAAFSEAINAMQLVAHGAADYARVERLGSGGYEIRVPFFHRFLNDPILLAVVSVLGLVAVFIELWLKLWEKK